MNQPDLRHSCLNSPFQEARHRSLIPLCSFHETVSYGVAVQDRDGIIVQANQAACGMLGLELGDILGRTFQDGRWRMVRDDGAPLSGDDHPATVALRTGSPVQGMVIGVFPSGAEACRWLHVNATPALSPGTGRVESVTSTFVDITERKRAESELHRSRRTLTTLLGNLPGMAYRCRMDVDWTMEFVSDGCRALLGYAPEDLQHNARVSFGDLVHREDRDQVRRKVLTAVKANTAYELTYRVSTAAGEERWVWEQGRAVRDDVDTWLEGFIADITEKVRTKIELQAAHDRIQAILINITDAFFALDRSWRITDTNAGGEVWAGKNRGEILGRDLWEVFPDAVGTRFWHEFHRAMSGEPVRFVEYYAPFDKWGQVHAFPTADGLVVCIHDVTALKQAELSVHKSDARFRAMFDHAGMGIVRGGLDGRLAESNPAFQAMLGYTAEELIGQTFEEITHPDDRAREMALFHQLIAGERDSITLEKRYRHKDGRWIWGEATKTLCHDPQGQPEFVIGMVKDLTKRRKAEALFQDLNQAIPQLVWTTRPDGFPDYFNERWYEYTGLAPGESDEASWLRGVHPDDLEQSLERWRHSLRTGEPYEVECRIRRASDGAFRWFLGRALPERDDEGAIVRWFGTCTDIHDHKRAKEANQQLASIVESSGDAIYGFDLSGTITSWNAGAEALYGYTADEMTGAGVDRILPSSLQPEVKLMLRGIASGGQLARYETRRRHKDGREIPVSVTLSPVLDEHGRVVGASAIARDISDRLRQEAALREVEERFRSAFENAPIGMALASLDGVFLRVNRSLAGMLGGTVEELTGRRIVDLTHPDDVGASLDLLRRLMSGREEQAQVEKRYVRADGRTVYGILELSLVRAQDGSPLHIVAQLQDITERVEAERILNRYRLLAENTNDIILFLRGDGRIVDVNEAALRAYGYTRAEMLQRHIASLRSPATRGQYEQQLRQALEGQVLFETEHRRRDGSTFPVEIRSQAIEIEGETGIVSRVTDISERRAAEEALRASEARFRAVHESAGIGISQAGIDGRFLGCNPALQAMIGFSPEEVQGRHIESFTHPDDLPVERALLKSLLAGERDEYQLDKRIRRKDGSYLWVHATRTLVRDAEGSPKFVIGLLADVNDRKVAEERLVYQAFHDALTNLPNRALFMDRLNHAIVKSKRRGESLAVLFLDLDRFKIVNDSLGHGAGDQLLVAAAARIAGCVRGEDTAARLGGDEFTILLESLTDEGDAVRLAERILRKLEAPFEVNEQEAFVSASIGIVVRPGHGEDAESFLRDADVAMYRAKAAGRGRYAVFERDASLEAQEQLRFETELRRAIERNEFQVYYQPIIRMDTGRAIGVEALVRWNHPRFGVMPPDEFISLQEQIGLIEPFTMWVLREAQTQCLAWHKAGHRLTVSVNLSPHNLHSPGFAEQVTAMLAETGLPPQSLKLEITESAVVMDPQAAVAVLRRLSAIGIRLAVDDFGTGYSSLSYLKQLPVHEVKIDKSFVMGMDARDDDDTAIVRAIIDLGHNLRKKVVAEGVESQAAWDMLSALGCDAAQGYLMGPPMPAGEARAWLDCSPWGAGPSSARLRRGA